MKTHALISRLAISLLLSAMLLSCEQTDQETTAKLTDEQLATLQSKISANSADSKTTESNDLAKSAILGSQFEVSEAPQKEEYAKQIAKVLTSGTPVLALDDLKDSKARKAQALLLKEPRLHATMFHPLTREALRSEVMSAKPALPGDRVGAASVCKIGQCYRVDIYNFFHNATVTGIVDLDKDRVIVVNSLPATQPDLSPRLEELAVAIAKHEPTVRYEINRFLKFKGAEKTEDELLPIMVSTKSALKNSLCERSKHLCVAPTYVLGDQALWVIVDLTEMRVAGLRWTTVGDTGNNMPPTIITERKLENEYVFKNFCEQQTNIKRDGWDLNYHLTTSDGLRVADVSHYGRPVFSSAKVVDWHVAYSRNDGFGYSDATGCPMFSSAVVVAYDGPKITPIMEGDKEVGFAIAQDFRQLPWPAACNYRYEERYEFYNDGRYRVALSNHGRGCGDDGTYRPVLRIELGAAGQNHNYAMQRWDINGWQSLKKEAWSLQPTRGLMYKREYTHRIIDVNGNGYLMAPSNGQFGDGGRGDNAYVYTTVKHAALDEGASDLVTLGSCCNTNFRQGPEQFMQPAEPLKDKPLVLWYVPQIKNDSRAGSRYCWAETQVVNGVAKVETWPCTAGPMFVPIKAVSNSAGLNQ